VTDSVTIGRPCCAGTLDCKNPLQSTGDRFCSAHQNLTVKCCVTDCQADVRTGYHTRSNADHIRIEEYRQMRGKAMFQLKQ
ncbi:hypothetical protein GYMLUDRAFT_157432, partial [Collybiopsis luxurians FD-317 M1]